MYLKLLFVFLLSSVWCTSSYKILGVFPHPGKSHVDVFVPLMKRLAEAGHEVTVISHFPLKSPHARYTDVSLVNTTQALVNVFDLDDFKTTRLHKYLVVKMLQEFAKMSCESSLNSKAFKNFMKAKPRFDVVIMEFFNSDCFLGLVHELNAPLIGMSSCTLMHWTNGRMGNPSHPAYIPNNLFDFSDRLDFLERLENTVAGLFQNAFYDNIVTPQDEMFIKKHFGQNTPPLNDIKKTASLILVNTHFSLNLPRPNVPAIIEVGGIHVGQPKKLPKDLEKWVNESTHGVIYFSLGSMIKGHTFPEEQRQAFLRAFARLPQRVLWKWETDTMPGKPDNVMIQKWMPQLDILCHPNVKAFISHGGLLGMTEAVHCGVPAVVMPQYGDQFTNAKALEANGGGVILNLRQADEEQVYSALKTILDPNFRKGAQELSARFRDRPLPPLETAIYWVEYVARHRGAHHMRTAAVDMPFYKYFLLDVIAFLLLVFGVISVCLFYVAKMALRKICGCWNRPAAKVKSN